MNPDLERLQSFSLDDALIRSLYIDPQEKIVMSFVILEFLFYHRK
jgi:hypothetical protein